MFDDKAPLISVILPVYNGERYVAEALTSILQQKHAPLEILVIDDGSTDGTAQVVQQFGDKVRYCYRANGGPAAARNSALQLAQGEFLAFLDADDIWTANSLQQQLACLMANPTAGIALGCLQMLLESRAEDGTITFHPWSTPRRLLILQCALVRRAVFDQLGTFDESYFCTDDIDWFLRVREANIPIVTHAATTVLVRRHGHNLTNQQTTVASDLVQAMKKSLDRRKAIDVQSTMPALLTWSNPSLPSASEQSPGKERT